MSFVRSRKKIFFIIVALIVLTATMIFFFVLPAQIDARLNQVVTRTTPARVSDKARALHSQLTVADLHADALLWNRDLLARNRRGHVDVPRLIEGNVALQVFSIVTKTPRDLNIETNTGDTDNITALFIAQLRHPKTWTSLTQRAVAQSEALRETATRSGGRLTLIETQSDLSAYLARRERETGITAALIAVEGAHALDRDIGNVETLFRNGVRMMSLTHFFDNEFGGSAHGTNKTGLTAEGKRLIKEMETRGIILDLAHASAQTIQDALAVTTKPVVVSHTGVRATCENNRNLTDEQLRGIARAGGVIGIGYWQTAVCGSDAKAIAQAIRHTANVIGVRHVALGSDFDGAVATPFDTTRVIEITDALLAENFSDEEVKAVMGGNVINLLMKTLPPE